MKKLFKVAAPFAVIGLGATVVMGLATAKEAPQKKEEEHRTTSLYVEPVRSDTVMLSVSTTGEVKAKTTVDLIPQVSGRIVHVADSFAEGGAFAPGDALIKIDDADYRLAFTRAEARVAEAKVRLEQELADAAIKAKQWEEWVHDGEPTPLALNKPQVAEAQAKLRAAEADLADARLDLERTEITLPYNGRVLNRDVSLGQYVSAGTKLGTVFATDRVEVTLPLTDKQLAELQLPIGYIAEKGAAPKVTLSATVGGKLHSWTGDIVRTHAAVDSETRLVYAVAEVANPYEHTMPMAVGLYVSASIDGIQSQQAYVLPRLALRSDDKVYVIKDDKLHVRTVEILSTSADQVLVTTGVATGEEVVTSPVRGAYDGMPALAITKNADTVIAVDSSPSGSR